MIQGSFYLCPRRLITQECPVNTQIRLILYYFIALPWNDVWTEVFNCLIFTIVIHYRRINPLGAYQTFFLV